MGPDRNPSLAAALVVVLAVLAVAVLAAARPGARRSDPFAGRGEEGSPPPAWEGGRGPYGLQLYDSPRYYPYYEARDYSDAWDRDGRCATYCSASEDGGCTVVCR